MMSLVYSNIIGAASDLPSISGINTAIFNISRQGILA